jgi:hypothetical protein
VGGRFGGLIAISENERWFRLLITLTGLLRRAFPWYRAVGVAIELLPSR